MKTIILNQDTKTDKPCVATVGFFDGVHRGHQYLIKHIIKEAAERGMESAVITFDRHPRMVLDSDYKPQVLSTYDEKMVLLSRTEIDNCVVLHFDKDMAQLSAKDFMQKILRDKLNVKVLIIGYDNHFGHDGSKESFDDYVRYGEEVGIDVIRSQALVLHGVNVSSSVIRTFISEGEMEMAYTCLGRPYTIYGKVISGYQVGRKIGFPTANMDTEMIKTMLPAGGVYAVKVRVEGSLKLKHGMMNIGTRPTFGDNKISLEVNIFDFEDEIYGKNVAVSFIHRLRAERKFNSPEELAIQLTKDAKLVKEQFEKEIEE